MLSVIKQLNFKNNSILPLFDIKPPTLDKSQFLILENKNICAIHEVIISPIVFKLLKSSKSSFPFQRRLSKYFNITQNCQ